jgi:hypothetical protein
MKKSLLLAAILYASSFASTFADFQGYRIAGIISFGQDDFRTIMEVPDGQQISLSEGDYLGDVQVIDITEAGVTLLFPDGVQEIQLASGDYISQPTDYMMQNTEPVRRNHINYGVVASDFGKLLTKKLDSGVLKSVSGLEMLQRLAPSARLVSVSYLNDSENEDIQINSLESGIDIVQQAISAKTGIRIAVEGDPTFPDFYVMPNHNQ